MNTYSTLIISYTNSIDGKCHIIWKRNSSSIRIIANDDLEIHAWLNTFIKQWQGRKSKIAKSHQNTAINENTLSMERRACQKIQSCCLSFCHFSPPPHFRKIRGTFAHSSSPEPPYLVENIPPSPRKLEHTCDPLVYSSGGGGGLLKVSEFKIASLCLILGIFD